MEWHAHQRFLIFLFMFLCGQRSFEKAALGDRIEIMFSKISAYKSMGSETVHYLLATLLWQTL